MDKVDNPRYSQGDELYSDMGGEKEAKVEVLDVWIEEADVEGETIIQYYYSFEFVNEHSPNEKGTVITKRRAEEFEEAWHPKVEE